MIRMRHSFAQLIRYPAQRIGRSVLLRPAVCLLQRKQQTHTQASERPYTCIQTQNGQALLLGK